MISPLRNQKEIANLLAGDVGEVEGFNVPIFFIMEKKNVTPLKRPSYYIVKKDNEVLEVGYCDNMLDKMIDVSIKGNIVEFLSVSPYDEEMFMDRTDIINTFIQCAQSRHIQRPLDCYSMEEANKILEGIGIHLDNIGMCDLASLYCSAFVHVNDVFYIRKSVINDFTSNFIIK